jgi:hypothetical protein
MGQLSQRNAAVINGESTNGQLAIIIADHQVRTRIAAHTPATVTRLRDRYHVLTWQTGRPDRRFQRTVRWLCFVAGNCWYRCRQHGQKRQPKQRLCA